MGYFTTHAKDRALERYGLHLTDRDLEDIYKACIEGRALCGKTDDRGHIYLMNFRGVQIRPLLSLRKTVIITFMPSEMFQAGRNLRFFQKTGTAKQKSATSKSLDGRPYHRERISIAKALEDEA